MIKGISEKEEKIIKEILSKYPYDFYYYGSRVKGDFTSSSDLDILTDKIPYNTLEEISILFNKSKIPYVVNILQKCYMEEQFFNLIKNDLVKIKK